MQKLTRVLSQMGGTLWLLGLAAIGAMLLAGRSLASDTTINFDNLPSGTQITNQYANQGIIFGVSPNSANDFGVTIVAAASGKAQSSPNVALITQGCSVEVRTVSAWAQFSQPHQKVSAFVGDLNGQSISVTIDTFDINGNAISGASLTQPLSGSSGVHTLISVTDPNSGIRFVHFSATGGQKDFACLAIDDLTFDTSSNPVKPDFSLTTITPNVVVPDGLSDLAEFRLHRFGGSVGKIALTLSGLPAGVTATFNQNPTTAGDGSQLNVTIAAAPNTSNFVAIPITITGQAIDLTAGDPSIPRFAHFLLTIAGVYDLRAKGIDITQGVQLRFGQLGDLPGERGVDNPNSASYRGVSLQSHGKTVVALYADAKGAPQGGVSAVDAELRGFNQGTGQELPGSPLFSELGPLTLRDTLFDWVDYFDRIFSTQAYVFTLPDSWTTGTITLQGTLLPPPPSFGNIPTGVECGGCLLNNTYELRDIQFTPTNSINIEPVQMTATSGGCSEFPPPSAPVVFGPAANVTPLPMGVPDYLGTIDVCDIEYETDSDGDAREDKEEDLISRLQEWNEDSSGLIIGVTTFDPGITDFGGGVFDQDAAVAVTVYSRPLTSVAHEMSHLLGRNHASAACNGDADNGTADDWPPDQRGDIQGVGLDRRGSAPYRVIAPQGPGGESEVFDFMSYCAPNNPEFGVWISTRGWNDLITRFAAGPAGASIESSPSNVEQRTVAGSVESDGTNAIRPFQERARDHFWQGHLVETSVLQSSNDTKPEGNLDVIAAVGFKVPKVRILSVRPATSHERKPGMSDYHLIARDNTGAVVLDTKMLKKRIYLERGGHIEFLSARLPSATVESIEIARNGTVLAKRIRSRHAPQVTILSPKEWFGVQGDLQRELKSFDDYMDAHPEIARELEANPSLINNEEFLERHTGLREWLDKHSEVRGRLKENPVEFMRQKKTYEKCEHHPCVGFQETTGVRWVATDVDNDSLVTHLDYSADDGRSWRPLFLGSNQNEATLPSRYFSKADHARVRLRVNDGFNESVVISEQFTAIGVPPFVSITSPSDGARLVSDAMLYLSADAYDDANHKLTGDQLEWYDGRRVIGHGSLANVRGLEPGTHKITVIASDEEGRTAVASVSLQLLKRASVGSASQQCFCRHAETPSPTTHKK